jgi:hypothetical protein
MGALFQDRLADWLSVVTLRLRLRLSSGIPREDAGSNTSTVSLRVVGDDEKETLESVTVKYGRESRRTRTSSNCKRQARPFVREDAPYQQTRKCQTVIKTWSWAPDGCFIPGQTGRLTVGRSIGLRLRLRLRLRLSSSSAEATVPEQLQLQLRT